LRLSGFGFQLDTGPMALLDLLECSGGDTFDRFMHSVMLLFLNSYRITGFLVQPVPASVDFLTDAKGLSSYLL
jgi:hypothetical protein